MAYPKSIVLIGAGKLATHLGKQLQKNDLSIVCVWSRTDKSAKKLGTSLSCSWTNKLAKTPVADLYIIAVKDDAIATVVKSLAAVVNPQALVVHTSGAIPATVFKPHFKHYGVFYPLQSFSGNSIPDFKLIPFCIDANKKADASKLMSLAEQLSNVVHLVNDEQRAHLHLAAIFTNNFTNYLQFISGQLLKEQHLPHSILQPLLNETARKLSDMAPIEAQTGPAIRGDNNTMEKHLELLNKHPEWSALYELLSLGIGKDLK